MVTLVGFSAVVFNSTWLVVRFSGCCCFCGERGKAAMLTGLCLGASESPLTAADLRGERKVAVPKGNIQLDTNIKRNLKKAHHSTEPTAPSASCSSFVLASVPPLERDTEWKIPRHWVTRSPCLCG